MLSRRELAFLDLDSHVAVALRGVEPHGQKHRDYFDVRTGVQGELHSGKRPGSGQSHRQKQLVRQVFPRCGARSQVLPSLAHGVCGNFLRADAETSERREHLDHRGAGQFDHQNVPWTR